MAREKDLEALLGEDLGSEPGLTGKAMFGGWAWLLSGNLLCCARHDGLLARLGPERAATAVDQSGIEPMYSGKRLMRGWVRAGAQVWSEDARRHALLDAALAFTRTLPAKQG